MFLNKLISILFERERVCVCVCVCVSPKSKLFYIFLYYVSRNSCNTFLSMCDDCDNRQKRLGRKYWCVYNFEFY